MNKEIEKPETKQCRTCKSFLKWHNPRDGKGGVCTNWEWPKGWWPHLMATDVCEKHKEKTVHNIQPQLSTTQPEQKFLDI